MKGDSSTLMVLAGHFALMSLFAIGGANAAVPEMHRFVVDVMGWMSDRQFADLFAIAQVTPGPNVIIVTLIGYHVAGLSGALVTTAAMCGPTCVFAVVVARAWERFREHRWRMIVAAGLIPVSIGLLAASALVVATSVGHGMMSAIIIVITAATTYWTRLNPLWLFAAAALAGGAGAF